MRYEVVFTQDGWAVRDTDTGQFTDQMVPTVEAAQALAEEHARGDRRIEAAITRWGFAPTGTASS
jgi:hypothetical protein